MKGYHKSWILDSESILLSETSLLEVMFLDEQSMNHEPLRLDRVVLTDSQENALI